MQPNPIGYGLLRSTSWDLDLAADKQQHVRDEYIQKVFKTEDRKKMYESKIRMSAIDNCWHPPGGSKLGRYASRADSHEYKWYRPRGPRSSLWKRLRGNELKGPLGLLAFREIVGAVATVC